MKSRFDGGFRMIGRAKEDQPQLNADQTRIRMILMIATLSVYFGGHTKFRFLIGLSLNLAIGNLKSTIGNALDAPQENCDFSEA